MRKKNLSEIKFAHILLLYLISFLIHCILNILLNEGPTVIIDEGLYTNIARSLTWDGEIAFRSQPVNYPYILYPILLVPIYKLNHMLGGDIYRWVQIFNTLLITSSVIPAWLFALDFTKSKEKAFRTAILVAIMPDMIMGGYEMTESLLWPLALWLIFFSYRWYTKEKLSYGLLTAIFTALMFFAKPGAIAFGAVLLIVRLIFALCRDKQNLLSAILSIFLLLFLVGGIYALYIFRFDQQSTLLGLYEKQTSEWNPKDILVAIEATFLTIFLFIFACGGIFALIPAVFMKEYDSENRKFIAASYLGILAVILGTAIFVVPYKWDHSLGRLPLHMRYCSMFIPAFFVFSNGLNLPAKQLKNAKPIQAALTIFAVLCIVPGARSGFVVGKSGTIDSIVLSAFHTSKRLNGTAAGWIETLLMLALIIFLLLNINKGWEKTIQKKTISIYICLMLFNAICAHINAAVPIDPTIRKDANEINHLIKDHTSLGITQRYYDDIYSYWLDCHLNQPMQQITIDQMFIEMDESKGIYTPFVPIEQAPNINNHITPDTDTFVLGMTIADLLELSDNTEATKTANGHFTVVKISPGERWVDTMLYGMDDNTLYAGQSGFIQIFSENRNLNGEMILHLTASGKGSLSVGDVSIQLDSAKKEYTINLPYRNAITIIAEDADAQIWSYSLEKS